MQNKHSKTECQAAVAVQRFVRPECGNHSLALDKVQSFQVSESDAQQSEQILRAAADCSRAFEVTVGKDQSHQFQGSLILWKGLYYPRPTIRIVSRRFEEWFPEFVWFLASYISGGSRSNGGAH